MKDKCDFENGPHKKRLFKKTVKSSQKKKKKERKRLITKGNIIIIINGTMEYVAFGIWLFSVSIMHLRFIYIVSVLFSRSLVSNSL